LRKKVFNKIKLLLLLNLVSFFIKFSLKFPKLKSLEIL
jgi:hypothetical protein